MFSLKPCTLPIRVLPVLPILYYHRKDGDSSAPSELQSSIPPFLYASTSACLQLASIPLYLLVAPSTACLQSSRAPYLHASLSLYRRRVFQSVFRRSFAAQHLSRLLFPPTTQFTSHFLRLTSSGYTSLGLRNHDDFHSTMFIITTALGVESCLLVFRYSFCCFVSVPCAVF